ncbi:hypothetical protein CLOM_g13180 [Closterium sp. NIES-68]|nr:hypothetical protein CLOM_g13180 [Closterium sp. NIES-68]GJP77493.1 hypothetical protein CLOP_g7875 [Closterium sp. NIES-67]
MYPVYFPSGQQPARFSSDKRGKWNINKVDDLSSSLFASTLSTSTAISDITASTSTSTSTTISGSSDFAIAAISDTSISGSSSLLVGSDSTAIKTTTTTQSTACVGMINPCGGGSCYMSGDVPRCNCSGPSNMVEVLGAPTSKCVPRYPCSNFAVNPCAGGTCTDVGDGTYTCACSAGYAIGAAIDGSPTCMPAAGLAKAYVTLPGDNCTTVATAFSILTSTLTALNPFINCSVTEYLPPGIALTVSATVTSLSSYCTSSYTVRPPDTCTSIANTYFGGSLTSLLANNPGLSCKRLFKSQQICLQMVAAAAAPSASQCGQSVAVVTGDTCASVAVKYAVDINAFLSLNPGINCNVNLVVGTYVCVVSKSPITTINCTGWYRVMQGDTCPSIWNAANLTMSMFLAINPGIQCQAPYFTVGQQVCINSPILATMQGAPNVSYYIHTVRDNETALTLVSAVYYPRCTPLSISPESIAAQNFIANLSTPLAVGTKLTIPCIGRIGIIDSVCATSLPICGSDFVTYPSYCDAGANYALPPFQQDACTGCGLACTNRMGLGPRTGYGCTQAICPYPAWFSSVTDCTYPGLSVDASPCCANRKHLCDRECNLSATSLVGTPAQTAATYDKCYNNCYCCAAVPCGGPSCSTSNSACSKTSNSVCSTKTCSYTVPYYWYNCTCYPAPVPMP